MSIKKRYINDKKDLFKNNDLIEYNNKRNVISPSS